MNYLLLILVWAMPIIVFQWLLGADLLLRRWKVLVPGILLPTFYLTIADSFALRAGTWTINPSQSLNVFLPIIHVPLEEAIFFLVTNTLLIQGLILFRERARLYDRVRRIRTTVITLIRHKPFAARDVPASQSRTPSRAR